MVDRKITTLPYYIKMGLPFEVNINLIPIIKHKKIVAIFGIAKDITKSKGIEKKLKKMKSSLKKFVII